jgi:peptidoglycan hydrolase CwlO-like protein
MSFKSIESINEEIKEIETKIEELGDMVPSKQAEFDEGFDECFPMVEFGDLKYLASHVLKEVDPIAYREEYLNWVNSRVEDLESELDDLKEELEYLEDLREELEKE